jgi:hypothetical protein
MLRTWINRSTTIVTSTFSNLLCHFLFEPNEPLQKTDNRPLREAPELRKKLRDQIKIQKTLIAPPLRLRRSKIIKEQSVNSTVIIYKRERADLLIIYTQFLPLHGE